MRNLCGDDEKILFASRPPIENDQETLRSSCNSNDRKKKL